MLESQARAMPIQMDMSSDGDITICTGLKRYIACRDGSDIAVLSAFWGRVSDKICPSDDGDPVTDCEGSDETLPLVKQYCETKNQCKLEAKHSLLQKNGSHHCPGVNKYLIVNYTCIPESKGVTLCDSAETTLSCQSGWVMQMNDIFWGRRSSSKYCGTEEGMECDSSESASTYLRKQCDGKHKCLVKADPSILDNTHSPCAGMLKYLMLNYICRPAAKFSIEEKEDKDKDSDDDDSKILQDTSSKELMGLLEKHLNEIKTPDVKDIRESPAPKPEIEKKVEAKQYNNQAKAATKTTAKKTRATVGRTNSPFIATEEDEITNTLLNSPAFTRSLKKQETPIIVSKVTRKSDTQSESKDSRTTTPEQEASSKSSNTAKDTVPKANDAESYELTEPNTVRSILARAKEVLKTLDSDTAATEEINKRGGIAHTKKDATPDDKFTNETAKAVKQVAKLAESLVSNAASKAIKGDKQKKTKSSVQKPRPGSKKSGYRGPGSAGIGNTP